MKEIDALQDELANAQRTGDRNAEYFLQGELGNAFFALKDFSSAIQAYKKALEISEEIGDLSKESATISNLGNAYAEADAIGQANESYRKAISLAQQIGDRQLEARAINNRGLAFYKIGDHDAAIKQYKDGLAIANEIADEELKRDINANIEFVFNKKEGVNSTVSKDKITPRTSRSYLLVIATILIFLAILGLAIFWILSLIGLIPVKGAIVTSVLSGIFTILGGLLGLLSLFPGLVSPRGLRSHASSSTVTQTKKSSRKSKIR